MCVLCDSWKLVHDRDKNLFFIEFNGKFLADNFTNEKDALAFMYEAKQEAAKDFHWEELHQQRADDEFDEMERERGY